MILPTVGLFLLFLFPLPNCNSFSEMMGMSIMEIIISLHLGSVRTKRPVYKRKPRVKRTTSDLIQELRG